MRRDLVDRGTRSGALPAARMLMSEFLGHKLVSDVLVLYGVQIVGYILPLLTLPYLAQTLGPANFGLLALGSALAQYFLMICEYGFGVTGVRRIAVTRDDIGKASRVYCAIMACKLLLVTLGFLVLVAIVSAIPALRAHWKLYMLSFLLVVGWALSPNWFFQGMQRMKFVAYSDYGAKILSVGFIFILVRKPSDYLLATTVQYGAFVVSACIGLTLVIAVIRVRIVRPRWEEMREVMVEGWPVFLSLAGLTFTSSSNAMILGAVAPPQQVGYLNAASRLIMAARSLANPIASSVYPHLSRLAATSPEEGRRFMRHRLLWACFPFLALSAGTLLFASFVVWALYGPPYAEAATLLQVMALTPFLYALGTCCFGNYMLAYGYEKAWARIIRYSIAVNFVLLFSLLPLLRSARAVALTTTLTDLFIVSAYLWFYLRTQRSHHANAPAAVQR